MSIPCGNIMISIYSGAAQRLVVFRVVDATATTVAKPLPICQHVTHHASHGDGIGTLCPTERMKVSLWWINDG